MTNVVYSKPTIEKVASFKESTKGIWFGRYRDVLGGRALTRI
ncbi:MULTISPECIES: lasso RiPP family leader peptide-containing protein [Paenibacillus]|uniref:Lasso RiPP family leader peptide-containing protein n=2 Tax=Paenibacillus TaxID=44249 RepID=A0ABT4E995_PAEAL|nr:MULTISPECIES: lasso RiPP family leader peptide-containing protein [Paenibacillus]EPY11151.1 hypothetical protein PAAL66ix_19139 [Paenibacillus alvei A6-6i-x]MCY9529640.1 lasso RiPP family leader peptide-containing protein [Paenibacillus alvei]TQR41176.1 lasso RiPP family leader peptide-containing protein [Paenibacillus sp. SDF0028]